ncbi:MULTISPECIES: DUF1178 family protein [Thalassobaculum]|uniref:DUF1178 family protein n=1 Tax=Thalassobaculum litoreum DSM 18839 TaxID=1123362 RepID=A0A8G2BI13_9PROT|nr:MULTISPECIES: DUF1178 family protein [Thalassobaculum]SDF55001.1 hypothetical protein SAMN05660686_01633 [Thalassobaculum litoreum DSM 18839]
MIHYRLRCNAEHEFEAWFQNSSAFEKQAESGLLSCPDCGSSEVSRALMAPALQGTRREMVPTPADAPSGEQKQVATQALALKQQLLGLRRKIEENFDNVGDRFADEARKIHYGDSDARGIYGDTTPQEREALADEGIEVGTIPWLRDDA